MKIFRNCGLVVVLVLSGAMPTSPQVPFNGVAVITTEFYGTFNILDSRGSTVLQCEEAGPDPEDAYDCKIQDGHTLNEAMRIILRVMKSNGDSCEADRKRFLKTLDRILGTFPKETAESKRGAQVW